MRFALLALVGLLFVAGDASAFFGRRARVQRVVVQPQQVVVGHHAQAVVVQPQRVVVQQQAIHAQPVVVQQQFHHAQPVIVSPARVFFAR